MGYERRGERDPAATAGEDLRCNLLIARIDRAVLDGNPVTDEKIRQEYVQHHWHGHGGPPAQELAEHREHMRGIIQQRKWTEACRIWRQFLIASAEIWRRTPESPSKTDPE